MSGMIVYTIWQVVHDAHYQRSDMFLPVQYIVSGPYGWTKSKSARLVCSLMRCLFWVDLSVCKSLSLNMDAWLVTSSAKQALKQPMNGFTTIVIVDLSRATCTQQLHCTPTPTYWQVFKHVVNLPWQQKQSTTYEIEKVIWWDLGQLFRSV